MCFHITDEEKRELNEEIFPHWNGTSAFDEMMSKQPQDELFHIMNFVYVVAHDFSGAAHLAHINYGKALEDGFEGIANKAEAGLAAVDDADPDAERKRAFFRSVILTAEAITGFAVRYSQLALDMADKAENDARAQELRQIAEITARVPAKPARNFREALQAYWFTYLALMNIDVAQEIPVGRLDQYLYPYYKSDLDEGRMTQEEAMELVEEFLIKFNQLNYLGEYAVTQVQSGNPMRPTVTLSGVDKDGNDATNDLTYLILEATDCLRMIRPNIAVRLHSGSPESFRRAVTEVMTGGGNVIEVFNDDVNIPSLTRRGLSEEAGRDYIIGGCVQQTPGNTYGPNCSAHINAPKLLEMFLNGGNPIISMTGDDERRPLPDFATYAEFFDGFKSLIASVVESWVRAMRVVGETAERLLPNPVLSSLIDGALENGKDVKSGGASNNVTGLSLVGLATLVDSLASVKHVVFEKKSHSLEEMVDWMRANFDGHEQQRQMLLNDIPKFGNGEPAVDEIAREVIDAFEEIVSKHPTYRGGLNMLGVHSETHHILQGQMCAASLDGRYVTEILSPGCGPTSGVDRQGPTASMRSVATVDHSKVAAGSSFNMRFNPSLFAGDEQVDKFGAMMKTYFDLGGPHLQISVADAETLRKAQAEPEKFEDLIVRVTGYSARFVELSPATQEEIISRTEMNTCG
jgi:formate C-acetyltransferase